MLAEKPGRAFVLAASRTPRRSTKSERREATRLSSRIPYVARHTQRRRLRCAASQNIVRACFDKQMAALSARSVGVGGAWSACKVCARRSHAAVSRETHVWAFAGAGRSSWYAFGWLALSRVGSIFERQDVSMQLYAVAWADAPPRVCITVAHLPGRSLVDISSSHRTFFYIYRGRILTSILFDLS